MATHFNAFISYRHSPLDSKIAQQIHRQLERFKIPKAIQKATGIKKIDRIFRDKEELPLSVNLSDDINEALIHSDFLIVICSPRFQQSQWCMREIELFLQTHGIERILIVLAEGEPDDVVPPILTQDREPLCCDYRMKPRKAKSIELPRLVSAILSCRYDDLRQRQRQYRMRRLVALFSAALIASLSLTAYFINTSIKIQKANDDLHAANVQIQEANVQIQNNLDQALRNQSQYLASSAKELMDAGDRLTAMALVLEALPSADNQRPYLPEAEAALSAALSAYEPNEQVNALGAFQADGLVNQFQVSDDGTRLYIKDARNVMTIWDTDTFQKLATIDPGDFRLDHFYLSKGGNIVVTASSDILNEPLLCYGPDGKLLWQLEYCRDFAFLNDRETVMVRQNDFVGNNQLVFLNVVTGEQVREPINMGALLGDKIFSGFYQMDCRSDRPVAMQLVAGDIDYVYLLDLQTETMRELMEFDGSLSGASQSVDCLGFDSAGNILVMRGDGSGMMNGVYMDFELTSPDRADIFCYDAQTLKLKWQSEITTYVYSNYRTIEPIPGSDLLLAQSGNTFQVHEAATGKCIARSQTAAIPLTLTVDADKTWGILKNGCYFAFEYDSAECRTSSFTDDTLTGAVSKKGYFVSTSLSYQVTVYRTLRDELTMDYDQNVDFVSACMFSGDKMMAWGSGLLNMIDTTQRKILWTQDIGYGWTPLGFSEDGTRFWVVESYEDTLREISVADGSYRDQQLPMDIADSYTTRDSQVFLDQEKLLYTLEADTQLQLLCWDIQQGQVDLTLELPAFVGAGNRYSADTQFLGVFGQYAWIWRCGSIYVINLDSGAVTGVASNVTIKPAIATMEGTDTLLVSADHQLLLTAPSGRVSKRIDLGEVKGVSVYCYGQELLVMGDDGAVYRYDRQGRQLSKTALNLYNSFYSNVTYGTDDPMDIFWRETGDGDLIVNAFNAGNIIDLESWQARAFVPQLNGYLSEQDMFVCSYSGALYNYHRYTTQEQIQKAKEALGQFQLTEEQRNYYGLN